MTGLGNKYKEGWMGTVAKKNIEVNCIPQMTSITKGR